MKKNLLLLICCCLVLAVSGCMPRVLNSDGWYRESKEIANAYNGRTADPQIPMIYYGTVSSIDRESFTIGKGKLLFEKDSWNPFPGNIENCRISGGPIYCRQFRTGDTVAVLVIHDIKGQNVAIRATKVEDSYATGFVGKMFQQTRAKLTKFPDEFDILETDKVSLVTGKRFNTLSYRCNRFTYRSERIESNGYEELHKKYQFSADPLEDAMIISNRTVRTPAGKVLYRSSAPAPEFEFYRLLQKYDPTVEEAQTFRAQMLKLRTSPDKLKIWFKDREKIFKENQRIKQGL